MASCLILSPVRWIRQRQRTADRLELEPADALAVEGFEDDSLVRGALQALAGAAAVEPAWNVRIDTAQVDPNSDALIASIGLTTALHPDWGTTETEYGIPYVVVDGSTPKANVTFDYGDESDPGPYPIPPSPDRGRQRKQRRPAS
jgi:hypothetical protein